MKSVSLPWLKTFFKETFLAGAIISLPVYAWVRIIFFEVPFSFAEDSANFFKTLLAGWLMMIIFRTIWHSLIAVIEKAQTVKLSAVPVSKWAVKLMIVVLLSGMLYACTV